MIVRSIVQTEVEMDNSSVSHRKRYEAVQIANEFIARGVRDGIKNMTNMKIQKLVYFAQGYCLACQERPLIHENFVAWKHGPVVRQLYDKIKQIRVQNNWDAKANLSVLLSAEDGSTTRTDPDDDETNNVLDAVWNHYKEYSPSLLRRVTHWPNSPWTLTKLRKGLGAEIPNEEIKLFFQYLGDIGKNERQEGCERL